MIPRLHVVTDERIIARREFAARAVEVLEADGPVALHLRGPRATGRRLVELAVLLWDAAASGDAKLLVNDRVDIALCLGLHGAHLGRRSLPPPAARELLGPDCLLGASVHDVGEALEAARGGVDFLFVGALWTTRSHPDRAPAGPQIVGEVGAAVSVPLVAIGGVTPRRVRQAVEAGAHGVAAVRGIWDAPSSGTAVGTYLQALAASPPSPSREPR